jgi:phosphotransferase system enzyme I (PtsI)
MTADLLAKEVAFFSIGTNDLIQYACAVDRESADIAHLRNPLQPAILRLLKLAIDAATSARLPISICGDMASDPSLTWLLLGLGLRDLSMDPHAIPVVKAIIRRSSVADAEAFAIAALASPNERETAKLIETSMRPKFVEELEGFLPAPGA